MDDELTKEKEEKEKKKPTDSTLSKVNDYDDVNDDDDDDYVDPRVQVELEQLNNATDAINRLEVRLDKARAAYRHFLIESSQRIKHLSAKLGNCVEKSQPYYEARVRAQEAHVKAQMAALKFEKANSAHAAAKEMVFHAEEGLLRGGMTFDPTWQEMLNHATQKVNEAERERTVSKREHRMTSQSFSEADQEVQQLQKELKKVIVKSNLSTRRSLLQLNSLAYQHQLLLLPYFELKALFNQQMDKQKQKVLALEKEILQVKQSYSLALNNLEEISIEIHQQRQQKQQRQELGLRGSGVGAESPVLPPQDRSTVSTDVDDIYLEMPNKMYSKTNSHLRETNKFIKKPARGEIAKEIICVDNACQTENYEGSIHHLSDQKSHSDRVSAWVHESGLRMLAAARSASKLPGPDATYANNLATMLLNATEESDRSDVESLNSTDVLTDEQIANLMLDKELDEVYQEIAYGKKNSTEKEFDVSELSLSDVPKSLANAFDGAEVSDGVRAKGSDKDTEVSEELKDTSEENRDFHDIPLSEITTPNSVTPSEPSSASNLLAASADRFATLSSGSSEFKVVAVQFTVQETVVTPKIKRKSSENSSSKS